jgi:hypothetical protein
MRGRALLAAVLVAVAIRCVPGQPGIINVGAVVPPMPLKTTPEGYDGSPASRNTFTGTPSPTRTHTPTPVMPTPDPGEPEPLPEAPPLPQRAR